MFKRFFLYILPLLLCWQSVGIAQAQQPADEAELVKQLLHGYLLAADGRYREAAPIIGEIGLRQKDSAVIASALEMAIRSGDLKLARKYAAAWVAFGGGIQARQAEAEVLLSSGQLVQAEQLLAGLMAEKVQASSDLLRQLSVIGDSRQAIEIGRRLFAADADGRYHLALLAFIKQNFPAALQAARQARAADVTRLDILFLTARIAQLVEGDDALLPLLQGYINSGCSSAAIHCRLDAVLWAFSDYLREGGQWRQALSVPQANTADWAIAAGNWYQQWNMPSEAKAAYQRGGQAFMAQLGLSQLAEESGDLAAALEFIKQADVKDSREFVIRETTTSHLLAQIGDLPAALKRVQQAQTTVPDNFSLMYHHSLLLEKNSEITAAVAVLKRATELFPGNPDGWNALGYVMADNNIRLNEAKEYIERALHLKSNDPNIIDSLGWVYYRLGDLTNARIQLEKAAALADSAEIYAHYGEVLWETGNTEQAKEIWRQAQQFDPKNKLLNETLARYNAF